MAKNKNTSDATFQSGFNLRDYLAACASKWIWFLVSVIVICGFAYYKVIRKMPVYLRTEQVLIKDEDSGNSIDGIASAFSSFGLGRVRSNVYNEIITFKSPALMTQVAKRLDLQVDVNQLKFPHGTSLFGASQPYLFQFPDLDDEDYGHFVMTVSPKGAISLERFVSVNEAGMTVKHKDVVSARIGVPARTPIGRVVITPNPEFSGALPQEETKYGVAHNGLHSTVESLQNNLGVDLADRDADVIEITLKNTNIPRAEAILSTMVEIYNQDWIKDKNRVSAATNEFIDERLAVIETELGGVDNNILSYKSKTMVPDLEESAKLNMHTSSQLDNEIMTAVNQMQMSQYLKEYITNPANANSVIPVNTGTGSNQLEVQISNYNQTLLARNNVEASTSANNPLVQDYDAQLKGQREAVIRAVNAQVEATRRAVLNMEAQKRQTSPRVLSRPRPCSALSVSRKSRKNFISICCRNARKTNCRVNSPPTTPASSRPLTDPRNLWSPRRKSCLQSPSSFPSFFPPL